MSQRMFKLTAISNFDDGTEDHWDVAPDLSLDAVDNILSDALANTDCSSWVFTIIRLKDV